MKTHQITLCDYLLANTKIIKVKANDSSSAIKKAIKKYLDMPEIDLFEDEVIILDIKDEAWDYE